MNEVGNIDALLRRIEELSKENERLKGLLSAHGISYVQKQEKRTDDKCELIQTKSNEKTAKYILTPQQKISLFRSLFKGREDVFARRWHSIKTGKSGYKPVCMNEWTPLCDKKKYKCAECPNRKFSELTDDDIYRHLAGKNEYGCDVIGAYAILQDDTCNFLCADFDDKNCEHGYQSDVLAYTSVCKEWGIPCSVERSRSGNGAHVWILFDQPVSAGKARRLGNTILTEAMNRDGRLSFKSYDRFFPNQDHMPKGGFGNLVALPLQGQARRKGNSVFVDDSFNAYPDQWEYLLSIKKIKESSVDDILMKHGRENDFGELAKTGESKPWETPAPFTVDKRELPAEITIVRANMLYIPTKKLPAKVVNHLKRIASFKNPEFGARLGMHLSTYNVPRIISCAEITDDYLGLPRGCEDAVEEFFDDNAVTVSIEDKTNHGCDIDVCFKGTLKDEQEEAVRQLMMNDNGVLHATTAFGKTVTAIGLIARRKVNTLILVHNKALAKQWKEHLEEFLQINCVPKEEEHNRSRKKRFSPVGMLYTGENSLLGIVDIALLQSCVSDNEVKTFVRNYGMVIVDECHHVSAANFEQILKYVNARYVYGLTATPTRKDGHHPIIFMQCGAIRYTADAKAQMAKQNFRRALIPRFTSFRPLTDDKQSYPQILHDLSEDKLRNQLIISDVVGVLKEGRTPIIVSKLVEHVSALADMLKPFCRNIITMTGSAPTKEKREAEERLKTISKDEPLVIVASISYIGEGFDLPRLDTLFLALPVSYKNLVAQYTGRLHRNYEGKKEVRVYDYVDLHQPMCETMYKRRLRGYAAVGYKIENAINDNPQKDSLHIIYNSENFESTFLQDIDSAKSSIILSCPIIRIYHRHEIIDHLARASARGVNIQVFVHKCGYDEDKLKELGINVVMKDSLSLQCAVIDKSLYWYGDVNILGFHASDSSIIRMDDVEVAGRFLDIIYGEKGK